MLLMVSVFLLDFWMDLLTLQTPHCVERASTYSPIPLQMVPLLLLMQTRIGLFGSSLESLDSSTLHFTTATMLVKKPINHSTSTSRSPHGRIYSIISSIRQETWPTR